MFSNLGNIGAQVFGALDKQKKEEKQYQSIISSTKALVSNADKLEGVSDSVKSWMKTTSATLDNKDMSSQEKAVLAQALTPMYNSVVGSAINQSMASDARKRQGMELNAALQRNKTAGIEAQLRTPGMTFEKLNASAEAAPEQTFSILTQYMSPKEALDVMDSTDELSRETRKAKLGLIKAQITETLTPKGVTITDKAAAFNRAIAAKREELGRELNATETAAVGKSLEAPRPLIVEGTIEDKILTDPETGKKVTVKARYEGNKWVEVESGIPISGTPANPILGTGGPAAANPYFFNTPNSPSSSPAPTRVRNFTDLPGQGVK
jgi:hypothetical protein